MSSRLLLAQLNNKITPPKWLPDNLHYEVVMGSHAYGVATESSDEDIYGWAIPPKEDIFPHLRGEIPGFGIQLQRFEQYSEHHIFLFDEEYDFTVYSVVKYIQLCMQNNPNMIDSLFVPYNCITHITNTGQILRDNRKLFLHAGAFHKFKGYAAAQLHKIREKSANASNPKRKESFDKYGYDVKFAYHLVRLLNECEQILVSGDLDLQRDNETLKAIRRGEWTEQQIIDWAAVKEKQLEELYGKTKIPMVADQDRIKRILLNILEEQYGTIQKVLQVNSGSAILADLTALVEKYR